MNPSRRSFLKAAAVVAAGGSLPVAASSKAGAFLIDPSTFMPLIMTPPVGGAIGWMTASGLQISVDPVEVVKGVSYTVYPREIFTDLISNLMRKKLGLADEPS